MISLLGILTFGDTIRTLFLFQASQSGIGLSSSLITCLSEWVKFLTAIIVLVHQGTPITEHRYREHSITPIEFIVPAVLNLINNLLFLLALHLGPLPIFETFILTKFPLTAIIHHHLIRPQLNLNSWLALSIVVTGLIIIPLSTKIPSSVINENSSLINLLAPPFFGLFVGINSAIAGVWTEKMLKREGGFWWAQFYLYGFGSIFATLVVFLWGGGETTTSQPWWLSLNEVKLSYYLTIVPITAGVGLTVTNILKFQDNIIKLVGNFSCIVTIFVAKVILFPEVWEESLRPGRVFGVGVVGVGTWCYYRFYGGSEGGGKVEYNSLPIEVNEEGGERISKFRIELWSPFFPSLVVISLLIGIFLRSSYFDSIAIIENWGKDIANQVSLRQPVTFKEVQSFSSKIGGEIKLHQFSWDDHQTFNTRSFSTYKSMCIEVRPTIWWPTRYWLSGNKDVDDLGVVDIGANNTWTRGFRLLDRKKTIGMKNLRNYEGEIRWVNGVSLGYTKDEKGNHPAAVMRPWAAMVSLAINGAEILEQYGITVNRFFDHYYLLGQAFDPSDWTTFLMNSALNASRKSLPGGQYGSLFFPERGYGTRFTDMLARGPTWHDESEMTGREKPTGLVCFESMVLLHEDQHYFRDAVEAEYYRRVALKALGYSSPRILACNPKGLNAVLLTRRRPLYNEEEIKTLFTQSGLNVKRINIETVVANGTFQEQIAIFHSADILVSVHGSHLNNQIFMEPTSTLIEVFPRLFYHDEQKRLAVMTKVHHVELQDNEYPDRFGFEKYHSTSELVEIDKCLLLDAQFPTATRCYSDHDCRICHRSIGAFADMKKIKRALGEALDRLASAPCSAVGNL